MNLPEQFGRYAVERLLGQGQMGTVFLAVDPLIERRVAVKVLRNRPEFQRDEADEWRARFEREVRVTGGLAHPNIVGVLDVGLDHDAAFIVMEYVDGTSLEELLARRPTLPIDGVLEICADVAAALDYAHAHGVVHRDIKPGNILLAADGVAKVADFGIAHVTDSRLTQTGMTYGTPAFMSPEQARATDLGPASDQFSLASVVYVMLSGVVPFSGSSATAVLYQLVHEQAAPLESVDAAASRLLDEAIGRAHAKDPSARFPSCGTFADALRAAAEAAGSGGPQATRPDPATIAVPAAALAEPFAAHSEPAAAHTEPAAAHREPAAAHTEPVAALATTPAPATTDADTKPVAASPFPRDALRGRRLALIVAPLIVLLALMVWGFRGADGTAEQTPTSPSTGATAAGAPGPSADLDASVALPAKLAQRTANATRVLEEVVGVAEGIPQQLLRGARCVAVIPGVIKVGFGFGGRHGKGLVSCRTPDGWSSPSFIAITGGSFGLQIGAQSTDLVLVFNSAAAAAGLTENEITLGGDASVAAGPVGRRAEAGVDIELDSEIYSYSRSKGLFAGISLEGATLRADRDAIREAYGRGVTPGDLLLRRGDRAVSPEMAELVRTLQVAAG